MPHALMDERRVSASDLIRLNAEGLSPIALDRFHQVRGTTDPRMPVEQCFLALLNEP